MKAPGSRLLPSSRVIRRVPRVIFHFLMESCFATAPAFFPMPTEMLIEHYLKKPGERPCDPAGTGGPTFDVDSRQLTPAERQQWKDLVRQLRD